MTTPPRLSASLIIIVESSRRSLRACSSSLQRLNLTFLVLLDSFIFSKVSHTASKVEFLPRFGLKLELFLTRLFGSCSIEFNSASIASLSWKYSASLSLLVYILISVFNFWLFSWGVGVYFRPLKSYMTSNSVNFL
mgnify:CR=1 FL=1